VVVFWRLRRATTFVGTLRIVDLANILPEGCPQLARDEQWLFDACSVKLKQRFVTRGGKVYEASMVD
jgi:hypothetical protein